MYEETFFAVPPYWTLVLTGALPLAAWLAIRALRPQPVVLARVVIAVTVAVPTVLLWVDRRTYEMLLYENGPVELWTAFLLLSAGLATLQRARREPDPPLRVGLAILGVAFILGGCEELSWGQNLFQWGSPDLFLRWNEQQETNLHNITGRVIDTKAMTILFLFGYGVVAPALARGLARAGFSSRALLALLPSSEVAPLFGVACVLCLDQPTGFEAELGELIGAELLAIRVPERAAVASRQPAAVAQVLARSAHHH